MKFMIDVAAPAELEDGSAGVQMTTYLVEAKDAQTALDNYMATGEYDKIVYEGDRVHNIIMGIETYHGS